MTVDFDFQVKRQIQHDGKQAYYEWGPLVFALPIQENVIRKREIERSAGEKTGFYDWFMKPVSEQGWDYLIDPAAQFKLKKLPGDPSSPWKDPLVELKGTLLNSQNEKIQVALVPLGSTLLRRTTFPLTAADAAASSSAKKDPNFKDEDDPMRQF